jgi:hypothetical protein
MVQCLPLDGNPVDVGSIAGVAVFNFKAAVSGAERFLPQDGQFILMGTVFSPINVANVE